MGETLAARLLSPLSVPDFVTRVWGLVPLHVAGRADRFGDVFSEDRLLQLLAHSRTTLDGSAPDVRAAFDDKRRRDDRKRFDITPQEAPSAFGAGATIYVPRLDSLDANIAHMCRDLRAELGYLGAVNCGAFWSPDGSGFSTHFDGMVSLTLQLSGTKRWRFARQPAIPWPTTSAQLRNGQLVYVNPAAHEPWEHAVDPAGMEDWTEVLLEPGHVLHMPPGTWHMAEAGGSSLSLALTFHTAPASAVVHSALASSHHDRAPWRALPPLLAGDARGGPNARAAFALDALLGDAIDTLAAVRRAPRPFLERLAGELHHGHVRSDR